MRRALIAAALVLGILAPAATARAEVLIRWDQDDIPPATTLGLTTVVVPAENRAAVESALARGYRLYLEIEAGGIRGFAPPPAGLAGVVLRGTASPRDLEGLERRLERIGARVLVLDERGKWPHIRSNWVTRNNEVLQVSGRSAQPWIESNAALMRILRAAPPAHPVMLAYAWSPMTPAESDEGPALQSYLLAIAEAGSFGGDLLLPIHERFQADLLLGTPRARSDWAAIRRAIEFGSWSSPAQYVPQATVGVITGEPMFWFEVMNLLLRHNVPFTLLDPARVAEADLASLDLLIVLGGSGSPAAGVLTAFAGRGGTVMVVPQPGDGGEARSPTPWRTSPPALIAGDRAAYEVGTGQVVELLKGIADPDTFALEVRQVLGRARRVVDIWNGITVLAAVYQGADSRTTLVTALNYAEQPVPVQLRVRGVFSLVHYESPEEPAALLPHTHRDGYTEFVLPALHTGARIYLSGPAEQ